MIDVIRDHGRLVCVLIHHRDGVMRFSFEKIGIIAKNRANITYYVKQILKENLRRPLKITNEMAWVRKIGVTKDPEILSRHPAAGIYDYSVLRKSTYNQEEITKFFGYYEIRALSGSISGVIELTLVGTQFPSWRWIDKSGLGFMLDQIQVSIDDGYQPISDTSANCGDRIPKLWALINSLFAERSVL